MRRVKCKCETRWMINVGDNRGWFIVPAAVAARALVQVGAAVKLLSLSMSPLTPIGPREGFIYEGDTEYVSKACQVCGWPLEYMPVP